MDRPIVIPMVLLCAFLAACSGGATPEASSTTPEATNTPSATATPLSTDSTTLDAVVWFGGFKLTLETAEVVVDDGLPRVDIQTLFANEGSNNARLNATLNLSSGGRHYQPSLSDQELPEVPGKTEGRGALSFTIDEMFSLDDAVLTIGNPDNNQAIVPFGLDGALVDLAPVPVRVSGQATGGELRIRARAGELRADIPERHDQVETEHLALTLDFDITYIGDHGGGYAFSTDNLALTMPDGTTVAVDGGPNELLRAGTTLPDQQVRFIVRAPVAGTYRLVVIDNTIDERGRLRFEIP